MQKNSPMSKFHPFSQLFRLPEEEHGLSAERRAILTNRIALLTICLATIYYIVEIINGSLATNAIIISLTTACILVITLNTLKYFLASKIIGLLLINVILLAVCSSPNYIDSGIQLHYITAAIVALVLFGYEEKKWGVLFTLLPLGSFILSYNFNISFIPMKDISAGQTTILFILNLLVFISINLSLMIMLLRLHFKVETKLRDRNFQLEKTNAELDRFVYSASHDLRAPLSSISGLITLQKMEPQSLKYLDLIQSRVTIMDKFIRDIIDFSRNARTSVVHDPVNLFETTKEIVDLLRITQDNSPLKIIIEIDERLTLLTDPTRLRVVLNNLISNSIKYLDNRKPDPYINIKAFNEIDRLKVEISDNGIGIQEHLQPKIFEMFFRATSASNGSGLGLYIVKESLEKINGEITFNSKFGKGTTFKISIPSGIN